MSSNNGSRVIIPDRRLEGLLEDRGIKAKISKGIFYRPAALIDALKCVSALMGIDFKRSNICIADAAAPIGEIITELLLSEAVYLTLCTSEKDRLYANVERYILNTGLSPAVVTNAKKAVASCDILIYTGGMDFVELESYIARKTLAVNVSADSVASKRGVLVIDDVVLQANNSPVIDDDKNHEIILTSRIWEGALLTIVDFDTAKFALDKAKKVGNLAKSLGIRIKYAVREGMVLDREDIYKYR